ncbi:hypothetical protein [Pseudomonas aeruginosa]|uniref:hypothetical protein n=1 Tax=Pseudomonas aeruginosa TaxID=287 RepID=UPI00235A1EFC|nr:hypothetical protein [Pseudomonas aeruginosa]
MSIDWTKAPEGATHWEPRRDEYREAWMKNAADKWFFWGSRREAWIEESGISAEREATFEARPQETWDGRGLPPVGTVVRVEPHNTMWGFSSTSGYERKILAYYGEYVWLGHAETPLETTRIDKVDFRPLSTPEQIAAEERAKAIEEMCFAVETLTVKQAKALFDAGYRRQEEGK